MGPIYAAHFNIDTLIFKREGSMRIKWCIKAKNACMKHVSVVIRVVSSRRRSSIVTSMGDFRCQHTGSEIAWLVTLN